MSRLRAWRNVRVRLLTILLVTLAAALGASTFVFNVLFIHSTSGSANNLLRARASSELSLLSLKDGRLNPTATTSDALADSEVWIFDRRGVVQRPAVRSRLDLEAAKLNGSRQRLVDISADDERLLAVPIVISGVRQGTLVTGISLAPYEEAEHHALLFSFVLALVILLITGSATWWLLKAALRPVIVMTEQAAAWSELDLDRRFEPGEPHDELTQLAATLDSMLDRIAASLRHERRFSAELSHELRTPLARVMAEVELALRRERDGAEYRATLDLVLRNAQQLTRIVEALFAAAQHEVVGVRGTSDAYDVAALAVEAVNDIADDRGLTVEAERPTASLRLGLDGDLAERVLQPVLENACRYGSSWARVRIARAGSKVVFTVEDDGPGVSVGEEETIFEPGRRGLVGRREARSGAGLGLALARRLARTASGDVVVGTGSAGGCFLVTLPAA